MPSATASRFIVPPALTTRSAKAIRLWASIARSGTISDGLGAGPDGLGLALGARDHHGDAPAASAASRSSTPLVERVVGVVGRSLGRRADDGEHAFPVRSRARSSTVGVGLEVGEVVVLLQARVAEQLPPRRARRAASPRPGSRRARAPGGGAERELALQARVLVVLHLHRADPQQRCRRPRCRPSRGRARGRSRGGAPSARARALRRASASPLPAVPRPAWSPTTSYASPSRSRIPIVWPYSRAVISTSCPAVAQALDDRPQDERVRRGRAVDPDPHRARNLRAPERFALGDGGSRTDSARERPRSRRGGCPRRRSLVAIVRPGRRPHRLGRRPQGKNSVKSNDIAPSAVEGFRHPQAGGPSAPALDLFKTKGVVGPLSTASKLPVDLGGPSVTVKVPQGGLVAIYARVTGQVNGGGRQRQRPGAPVRAHGAAEQPGDHAVQRSRPADQVHGPGSGGQPAPAGVANPARGGFVVFSPVEPGQVHVLARGSAIPARERPRSTNAGLWAGVVQ